MFFIRAFKCFKTGFFLFLFFYPTTSMAGRPKDPVWLGFEKTDTVSGPRAKCRGCGLSLSGLVDRLKKHVKHCARLQALNIPGLDGTPSKTPPKPQPTVRQLLLSPTSTTEAQHLALNLQLCRFVLATAIAFRAVENEQFLILMELLRPGFRPAGERALAGVLLDRVYEECVASIKQKIWGRRATISLDGWSI